MRSDKSGHQKELFLTTKKLLFTRQTLTYQTGDIPECEGKVGPAVKLQILQQSRHFLLCPPSLLSPAPL